MPFDGGMIEDVSEAIAAVAEDSSEATLASGLRYALGSTSVYFRLAHGWL
jgi:hypothetical protein